MGNLWQFYFGRAADDIDNELYLWYPFYAFEVWLSLVERYVRDVEAAGSNPVTSTSGKPCKSVFCAGFKGFLFQDIYLS